MTRQEKWWWAMGTVFAVAACGGGGEDGAATTKSQCSRADLNAKVLNASECSRPERSSVLMLHMVTDSGTSICSGTLIAPTKVLTAAHCLSPHTRQVRASVWTSSDQSQEVAAKFWIRHPGFARRSHALINDVAVIVMPQALPHAAMAISVSQPSTVGQSVYLAGWGEPSRTLSVGMAQLDRVNAQSIGFLFMGEMSNTCNGDSGGPAYRTINGRAAMVGITSSGTRPDCAEGDESLFTNVQGPEVLPFIRSQAPEADFL